MRNNSKTINQLDEALVLSDKYGICADNNGKTSKYSLSATTSPLMYGESENSAVLKGGENIASGNCSTAFGLEAKAKGEASHAEGYQTKAYGGTSHAEGYQTGAGGGSSHAEGMGTEATGVASHAEGYYTNAKADYAHAEGQETTASHYAAHAEGYKTTAQKYGHAEGRETKAVGETSHAEGLYSEANGIVSHAEGRKTIANGEYSHSEGRETQANGNFSHAEGKNSIANGEASHASGYYTTSNNTGEASFGQFNVSVSGLTTSENTAFSVGIGTRDSNRKNAFEIKQNGDIYIEGVSNSIQTNINNANSAISKLNGTEEGSVIKTVTDEIAKVVADAPAKLDTLKEIADYIASDEQNAANVATTLSNHTIAITNMPFDKGISENSVVLKGGDNTAGIKGWYYSLVNFETNEITLSDVQPNIDDNGNLTGGGWNNTYNTPQIGELLTIVNNSIYEYCSTVVDVIGNIIKVDTIPFNSIVVNDVRYHDFAIYIHSNPSSGIIDFGKNCIAEGIGCISTGRASHAEGNNTHSYGHFAHTEGRDTTAGYSAHAEGRNTHATGEQSHTQGLATHANGTNSFAAGRNSVANGDNSTAMGYGSISDGNNSFSIGINAQSKGTNSISLGNSTKANGDNTFAEGNNTINNGNSSHVEGLFSKVDIEDSELTDRYHRDPGYAAHAEGYTTLAVGCAAHAEGLLNKAIGLGSHAEGYKTVANGNMSHTEGQYTEANNKYEHASGTYNISTKSDNASEATRFSIGIGTSKTNRKNAFEVKQNGDIYINGLSEVLQTYLNSLEERIVELETALNQITLKGE